MLPHRMARIVSHLGHQDSKATMDAVLSLRVSFAMTVAQEAETRCRDKEVLLRHNQLQAAGIAACVPSTALQGGLISNSQGVLKEARSDLRSNRGYRDQF